MAKANESDKYIVAVSYSTMGVRIYDFSMFKSARECFLGVVKDNFTATLQCPIFKKNGTYFHLKDVIFIADQSNKDFTIELDTIQEAEDTP